MKSTRFSKINQVEYTDKILTSTAGLLPYSIFLENSGLLDTIFKTLNFSKKSSKGQSFNSILKQILCFMTDGQSHAVSYFDHLQNDPGYAASIELRHSQLISSHTVKRTLRSMSCLVSGSGENQEDSFNPFRSFLEKQFQTMLQHHNPDSVVISIDSMVLDNDLARKREGCAPTYKKVAGFHPLHAVWNGYFIDAIWRPGNHHSNHENQAQMMITRLTKVIRDILGSNTSILFRMDSAFYDQTIMKCCENLGVQYLIAGRNYGDHIDDVEEVSEDQWKIYDNGHQQWQYCHYKKQRKSWNQERTFYHLFPIINDEDKMQQMMSFGRLVNLVVTNLEESDLNDFVQGDEKTWQDVLIGLHHGRGTDELVHRAVKEFGGERMPFKNYEMNAVWYYLRVLSNNCHVCFDEGVVNAISNVRQYVSTTRRRLFRVAGQIVKRCGTLRLHINRQVGQAIRFQEILELCYKPKIQMNG